MSHLIEFSLCPKQVAKSFNDVIAQHSNASNETLESLEAVFENQFIGSMWLARVQIPPLPSGKII
jgi:hypothetical protein